MQLFNKRSFIFYSSVIHPFVSVAIPLSFLVAVDICLRGVLGFFSGAAKGIFIILLIGGIENTVVGNIFYRERIRISARFREVIIYLLIVLLYAALFRRGRFLERVNPISPGNLYTITLALAQWSLTALIHGDLRQREVFLKPLVDKRGEDLVSILRNSSDENANAVIKIKAIKRLVTVFQFTLFVLLLFTESSDFTGSPKAISAAICFILVSVISKTILNIWIEEHGLAADEHFFRRGYLQKRLVLCLCLLPAIAIPAFLSARNMAIVPGEFIVNAVNRLMEILLPGRRDIVEAFERMWSARALRIPNAGYSDSGFRQGSGGNGPLFAVIKYVIYISLGGAVFYFLLYPLLSRKLRRQIASLKTNVPVSASIKKLYYYIALLLKRMLSWFRTRQSGRARRRPVKDKIISYKNRPISIRKRRQIGIVVRAYMKLIDWGKSKGVSYLPSFTPHEYTEQLTGTVPEIEGILTSTIDLFEEILFSPSIAVSGKVRLYLSGISQITQQGK